MNTPQSPGHEFWEEVIRRLDKIEFSNLRNWMKQNPRDLWITTAIGRVVMSLYNELYDENESSNIVELKSRELWR
jgi:hypothetical protein